MTDLSPEEQGRMIAALRRPQRNLRQRWSDTQIRKALSLTLGEFKRADKAVPMQGDWNRDSLARAVLAWALAKGRWPTATEMDAPSYERKDLPARSTLGTHWRPQWRTPPPFDQLLQHIVDQQVLWEQLSPALILGIRNVTVRRHAMTKYGIERLLREGGAERYQQDDSGTLWRMASDNSQDKHAQWVEVVNATPEKDGSHAHYFLRVPPTIETAHDAVAWTFETTGETLDIQQAS